MNAPDLTVDLNVARVFNPCCVACQALPLLALAMFTSCTVGPDYRHPATTMPSNWISTTQPSTQPSVAVAAPHQLTQWWTSFNDPALNSLILRAVQSNLDLIEARARVREARASRGIITADLFPTVDATASYSRSGRGPPRDLYRAGFDASWELDVFGGTRREIEAANADIRAAVEDLRDVLVTLTSEVAINYIDLLGFRQEIEIAKRNLVAQRRNVELTRDLKEGGFVSGLDLINAEAQVASTESRIPLLESAAQQVMYQLSLLLGLEPAALLQELSFPAPIPSVPTTIPVGLPSDLLRRRPDIRRAEAQLHSTTARIGVATADLFPRFALTGSAGTSGRNLAQVANWDNRFWSIGPGVSWNIFDAGRIRSNIAVQNARQEQVLASYTRTVLTALRDVESALIAYEKEQQHRRSLAAAVEANRRAVVLATRLYTEGQTDFLNVLSAQGALYSSEDALVQSDRTIATNLVALYKALGGGWETSTPTTRPVH
jgi:outer membrane protein, multidrug efflux system